MKTGLKTYWKDNILLCLCIIIYYLFLDFNQKRPTSASISEYMHYQNGLHARIKWFYPHTGHSSDYDNWYKV